MTMLAPLLSVALAAAPSPLDALRTAYLDGLFRARPHMGTYMGDHRHEAEVMDLSDAATRRRLQELSGLQRRLGAIDRARLSPDDQADAQILSDGIALEALYLRDIREWTWNPRLDDSFPFYDPREFVASRLSELIHGAFAPEPQRLAWAAAQLRGLPRLLAQEKAALTAPSRVHLEQAVKDNAGRIEFFKGELAAFTRKDAAAEKARTVALAALEDYQRFLSGFPREKATHDWRLGAALYAKKFPLALQTDLTPDGLERRAEEAFRQARTDLYAMALRVHASLWPKEPRPAAGADLKAQAQLIRRVLEELSKNHPAADALVQAHAEKLAELRAFIQAKNLLRLPPADTLRVEPMPEYKRGGTGAEYLSPGMLDRSGPWHGTFYVDPVDPSWPPARVESYLRANDTYAITLTSAHEAYPGHHTQAWYARQQRAPLRDTLWSGAFAEGWAVYGENLLIHNGLGGPQNDRFALRELRSALVVAANAILDIRLQSGRMTDAEALRFMEEDGFQEQALAERKLLRAKLDSTQLCQYFLGYSELLQLERDVRARGPFDQRAFDEAVVGHGTIPVKVLRGLVLRPR